MLNFEAAEEAAEVIRWASPEPIEWAIVLGSGLGPLADRVESPVVLEYGEIPHFPATTVVGHAGRLVIGTLAGRRVAVFQGRFHYYEGHSLEVVTFPIRVIGRLRIPRLILTAATGGIREDLGPGSIVALYDHLNLIGASPLRGPNDDRFGKRFPDMTEVYSAALRELAGQRAGEAGIDLGKGVYACMPGPNYETPAEVRMLGRLGADVVGMSTVPEAVVARQMGLEVLAFAIVANWAAGLGTAEPLTHDEVVATVESVALRLADLIEGVLRP